jgi:FkbM family methyltransferase
MATSSLHRFAREKVDCFLKKIELKISFDLFYMFYNIDSAFISFVYFSNTVLNPVQHCKGKIQLTEDAQKMMLKSFPRRKRILPSMFFERVKLKAFFSHLIQRGDLCFDVGANVGNFTDVMLSLGAKVVCVEPQNQLVEQLAVRFRRRKNVKIVKSAIGEADYSRELFLCDEAHTLSTLSTEWVEKSRFSKAYHWRNTQKVNIVRLDTLMSRYGFPKYCKIDVEGYEKQVLKGLTHPIPYMSLEFHADMLQNAEDCIEMLLDLGYTFFTCTYGETDLLFSEWVGVDDLVEKITNLQSTAWGNMSAGLHPDAVCLGQQVLPIRVGIENQVVSVRA